MSYEPHSEAASEDRVLAVSQPRAAAVMRRPPGILSQSTPLVYNIFRSLGDSFELARAATVSRLWRDVASVPSLWAALLEQEHLAASAPSTMTESSSRFVKDDLTTGTAAVAAAAAAAARDAHRGPSAASVSAGSAQRLKQQPGGQQRQTAALLPRNLLQPPCDVLSSPASQLGRWFGIRRLASQASRLQGVRGAWGSYVPYTSRLVVLDQESQKVAFVDLERAAGDIGACASNSGGAGSSCRLLAAGTNNLSSSAAGGGDDGSRGGGDIDTAEDAGCVKQQLSALRLESCPTSPVHTPRAGARVEAALATAAVPLALATVHAHVPKPGPQRGGGTAATEETVARLEAGVAVAAPAPAGPAPEAAPQGEPAAEEDDADGVRWKERCDLQVVASCGGGLVATGHPDGRVLVWDSACATVEYTLPLLQGCGRGPVLALAADENGDEEGAGNPLLAVAYRREVLVWELPGAPRGGGGGGGGSGGDDGHGDGVAAAALAKGQGCLAAPSSSAASASTPSAGGGATAGVAAYPRLVGLIKPSLCTAIQSMSLSGRHAVLALRGSDGVELRDARGGRWLLSLPDRRNTAVLATGDVLFIASSSPSFLGNNFLQFQIEVVAVDLTAVVAAAAAADAGGAGGGGSGAGAAPATAAAPPSAPLVIRTIAPPQHYPMRGPPLTAFKWDQPLQLCLTGGLLLLRCLQFPVAAGELAWPGLFAFRLGDLVSGLALGWAGTAAGSTSPGSGSAHPSAGESQTVVESPPPQQQHQQPAETAAAPWEAVEAEIPEAEPQQARQGVVQTLAPSDAAAAAAAPPPPPPAASPTVVLSRTVHPKVLCGDGGFATEWLPSSAAVGTSGLTDGTAGTASTAAMRLSVASVQLLAARRHLVILSDSHEAWVMDVPYCGPPRA